MTVRPLPKFMPPETHGPRQIIDDMQRGTMGAVWIADELAKVENMNDPRMFKYLEEMNKPEKNPAWSIVWIGATLAALVIIAHVGWTVLIGGMQ